MSDIVNWEPDRDMIEWSQKLIGCLNEGGVWTAPVMGIFRISHEKKTLTMTLRTPMFDPEMYRRTVITFKEIGYEVIDQSPEKLNNANAK